MCRAALALTELREKARDKFELADRMFFDREALEMASRQEISRYRAGRVQHCDTVMDLCCGIGGDLVSLGAHSRVRAVEIDRVRLEMARMNAAAAGLARADFIQADVRHIRPTGDAVFIDPSRRAGEARARRAESYSPPLSHVQEIRRSVPATVAKVGPAIDEHDLPADAEVEFISSAGQCREAVLYFGPLVTARRRATVLPGPHSLVEEDGADVPVAPPGAFVFDPDPAVVRSHLLDPLARRLGAWKLDPRIAYLSADTCCATPFSRCYRVLDIQPFQVKRLRQYLRAHGFYPDQIKKRGFAVEPAELRQLLRVRSGERPATLIATRLASGPVVMICEKPGDSTH